MKSLKSKVIALSFAFFMLFSLTACEAQILNAFLVDAADRISVDVHTFDVQNPLFSDSSNVHLVGSIKNNSPSYISVVSVKLAICDQNGVKLDSVTVYLTDGLVAGQAQAFEQSISIKHSLGTPTQCTVDKILASPIEVASS